MSPLKESIQGVCVSILTVVKSGRNHISQFLHKHPHLALFLAIYGVLLWPMSTTAVVGSIILIGGATATLALLLVVVAPILFVLTALALEVWIVAVAIYTVYKTLRHSIQRSSSDSLKHDWERYASTLAPQGEEPRKIHPDVIRAVEDFNAGNINEHSMLKTFAELTKS